MLKDILGALVFTAAVLFTADFIGDALVRPQVSEARTESLARGTAQSVPQTAPEPKSTLTPESTTQAARTPASRPAAPELTAGDVNRGKKLFRKKCKSCHTHEKGDKNRTGPNLWGVVGRTKTAIEGFRYSATLAAMGGVWTETEILSFIAGPRTFVPDTKMVFPGLKKESDRADVLAFLKTLND